MTGAVLDTTVAGILREAARETPDVIALVHGAPDPARRRRWTYAELAASSERAASALAWRFDVGERVAVWGPSLPESLILTYAAAMASVVLVPVNPALRADEADHILRQSGASGVFVAPEFRGHDLAATLASIATGLPALRHVIPLTTDDFEAFCSSASGSGSSNPWRHGGPAPDDVAQLIYTSGTTGTPKGALLTRRGATTGLLCTHGFRDALALLAKTGSPAAKLRAHQTAWP